MVKFISKILTVKMLEKSSIWSILKHHHPGERLTLLAITKKVHKILMVHFG